MEFIIDQQTLSKALSRQGFLIEKKPYTPVLAGLLVDASLEHGIRLTGTNIDATLVENLNCEVKTPGSSVIPFGILHELVKRFQGDYVAFKKDGENVVVKSGRAKFDLPCLDGKDFPQLVSEDFSDAFQFESKQMRRIIDCAHFSMSSEESRYLLNTMYLRKKHDSDQVIAVATDACRLSLVGFAIDSHGASKDDGSASELQPQHCNDDFAAIISKKSVSVLHRLLDEHSGNIKLMNGKCSLQWTFPHWTLRTQMVDGTFPDYESIVASVSGSTAEIKVSSFINAVGRISMIADFKQPIVKMDISGGKMTLSSHGQGTAEEVIDIEKGDLTTVMGMNAKYLTDVLRHIHGDTCVMEVSTPEDPIIFRDVSYENDVYLVMPARV